MGPFSLTPPSPPGGRSTSGRPVMPCLIGLLLGLLLIFVPARPAASAGRGDQPPADGGQSGAEAQDHTGQTARKEKSEKRPSDTSTPAPAASPSPAPSPTPSAPPAPAPTPSGALRPGTGR